MFWGGFLKVKSKRFEFKATDDEILKIRKRASDAGLSMSEFIRQSAIHASVIQYDREIIYSLIKEINKIGTNVNQVARLCNESKFVSANSLRELQSNHAQLVQMVASALAPSDDRLKLLKLLR